MKNKIFPVFFAILFTVGLSYARTDSYQGQQQNLVLAQDFTEVALKELNSKGGPSENTDELAVYVQDYANKLAEALSKEGIAPAKSAEIMSKAAVWFGDTLLEFYTGQDYNTYIGNYSLQLSALLGENKVDLKTQEGLISLSAYKLREIRDFLKRYY